MPGSTLLVIMMLDTNSSSSKWLERGWNSELIVEDAEKTQEMIKDDFGFIYVTNLEFHLKNFRSQ